MELVHSSHPLPVYLRGVSRLQCCCSSSCAWPVITIIYLAAIPVLLASIEVCANVRDLQIIIIILILNIHCARVVVVVYKIVCSIIHILVMSKNCSCNMSIQASRVRRLAARDARKGVRVWKREKVGKST